MSYFAIAAALIAAGALYIRLRWRRSPQAYRAMIAVAVCYLEAGAILGACVVRLVAPAHLRWPRPPPSLPSLYGIPLVGPPARFLPGAVAYWIHVLYALLCRAGTVFSLTDVSLHGENGFSKDCVARSPRPRL